MDFVFRRSLFLALGLATLGISSCGLVRSAIQIPARTLQGVGRTAGFGLEATEVSEGRAREHAQPTEVTFVKVD